MLRYGTCGRAAYKDSFSFVVQFLSDWVILQVSDLGADHASRRDKQAPCVLVQTACSFLGFKPTTHLGARFLVWRESKSGSLFSC